MGAFLLAAGTKGKRLALPNSEIMIHQPLGQAQGQATDILIHAHHIEQIRGNINKILAEETGKPAGAMVLPDGRVVTGKTSSLLGASASLLLNALKAQGGVSDKLDLISAQVIEPISKLKIESLGHHNPRLHSDEVLIALCISALTNPIAQLAQEQLGSLRGCDAHFSVIISEEDIKLYKRLGIHVTCEPRYEIKKLYHK